MNIKLINPKLYLTFEGNDLEPGHDVSQTIESDFIINRSFSGRFQRLNGLKSSSDQVSLQIKRKCASTEDIIATQGNIRAVLMDGDETVYTGYLSTSWKWTVTDHGEQALNITIEGVGTRLFNQPFIETGKHFFRCSASAAVYAIIHPLGITMHLGDERKILQEVSTDVDAGTSCRELLDQLLFECNAYYWFDNLGEMRIDLINPETVGAEEITSDDLYSVNGDAVSLSKSLRTYKGARVRYTVLGEADNYLVYRNTTGQDSSHPYCNLELKNGEYVDGTEIYTAEEWAEAQADEFREPALIGAVNADSESSIVGSGKIVNIDNLAPNVIGAGMTCDFENVGGGYFKITAHNASGGTRQFTRMDLYASIVFEKSHGVIRTQIEGSAAGKTLIEEELKWIHDRENASAHANLLSQYHQFAGATYTFRTKKELALGSVIRLNETLYSGLDVYVLLTGCEVSAGSSIYKYTGVAITTFDLSEPTYHGTTQEANQSGAQGPAGEPGKAAQIQYAIGDSIINPPADEMLWNNVTMEWDGDPMLWQTGLWGDDVPEMERGKYVWMRTRVGDSPWQYTRLTGSTSWDAENLGIATTETPKKNKDNLNLIPGVYFVAGATFTEDGVTYSAGFAYRYNGVSWAGLDLTDKDNASKAFNLLCSLGTAEIQIPASSSAYSVWTWTKNFVAQNAVVYNLITMNLDVGPGDGTAGSGFRFRALDNNGSPIFDIMYGDSTLFSVEIATGKIYFGTGFWYDPSDQAIHSFNDNVVIDSMGVITAQQATFNNALIQGNSEFQGSFDCDVIKTVGFQNVIATCSSTTHSRAQVKEIVEYAISQGFEADRNYEAELYLGGTQYASVKAAGFKKTTSANYDRYSITLIDSSYNAIDMKSFPSAYVAFVTGSDPNRKQWAYVYPNDSFGYNYFKVDVTLKLKKGKNVLQLDIPSHLDVGSLSAGQMFYGPQTTVGAPCYPLYIKA